MHDNENARIPVPGEIWWPIPDKNDSPWPDIRNTMYDDIQLIIKDVKDGWVRYDSSGNDSIKKVEEFVNIFELKPLEMIQPKVIEVKHYEIDNTDYTRPEPSPLRVINEAGEKSTIISASFVPMLLILSIIIGTIECIIVEVFVR